MHAFGEAIDVNPVENPYLEGGKVLPPAGAPFLDRRSLRPGMAGRAGALITAGLASWMLGQYEQALDEVARAHRIAAEIEAQREICITAVMQALALIFLDPEAGLRWAEEGIETSRAVGFTWAEGIASTVAGILHALTADPNSSQARHSEALEIQRRLGDWEGAGMSLGGLAQLASGRGDTEEALELYRQSLAAFEEKAMGSPIRVEVNK